MKSIRHLLLPSVRATALLSLLSLPAGAAGNGDRDRAAEMLARHGTIAVSAVGPYVEVGTFQIQVAVKLGQPSARLSDGTWLYDNYAPLESSARGTLIVGFTDGKVSSLALATPVAVAALRSRVSPDGKGTVVVTNNRR